ncbi:MAG: PAS domain S-box protein [Limisphaerales bacterium]
MRRRAESRQRGQERRASPNRAHADNERLLRELEIQNQELRAAREKAEALLEKYTDLYDFTPVGYLTLNRQGVIREANLVGASLLGMARSTLINRHFRQFVSADGHPIFEAFLRKTFGSKVRQGCEMTLKVRGKLSLEAGMEAVAFASGQACRVAMTDITVRKEAGALLARSRDRFNGIIAAAMDAIISIDSQQRIVLFNSAAERMFGVSASEAVGESISRFIPAKFRAGHAGYVENFGKTGETSRRMGGLGVVSGLRANGEEFPIEASISHQIEGSGEHLFTVILRDITARRRAEETLYQSEQRLRFFFESAPAAIAIFDARMCYLAASKRWLQDFQLSNDLIGMSHYDVFPEIPPHWKQIHQRCLAGAIERSEKERFVRANGTITWLKWEVRPWLGSSGAVGGIIILTEDITERKLAEEELRSSREQLRALAARIQAAREETRAHAAREIHDVLAQELTGIKIDLAWLSRRLAKPIGAVQKRVLQEKVAAMMDLTDKASQSVQRIATELRPLVLDSLGLCAAAEWAAADFQKRTEIRCKAIVPGQGLELDRDRSTALFRILQESLTNVARHARSTKVEIQLRREAGEVILTVHDNGRGVRLSELKDARSMGLLGMRERASLLGGQCVIGAQAGGGTMVEVRLPVASTVNPENKA